MLPAALLVAAGVWCGLAGGVLLATSVLQDAWLTYRQMVNIVWSVHAHVAAFRRLSCILYAALLWLELTFAPTSGQHHSPAHAPVLAPARRRVWYIKHYISAEVLRFTKVLHIKPLRLPHQYAPRLRLRSYVPRAIYVHRAWCFLTMHGPCIVPRKESSPCAMQVRCAPQ